MLVGLQRADGAAGPGAVQVVIDYAALAKAYGGGYGSRLALFALPSCALSTPWVAACRTRTPLAFTNRAGADQLVTTLTLRNGTAAGGSSTASRGAARPPWPPWTPPPTCRWSASPPPTPARRATTAPPRSAPPAPGRRPPPGRSPTPTRSTSRRRSAAAPNVAFSYDSQSVDGETSARNAQASWIGDGWNYQPGFIERSYRGCGSLLKSDGSHVLKGSGDECWVGDNATISFGSHSGQLVPTTKDSSVPGIVAQWKLQGDDGTVVQELSGAQNGLYQGIYYRVLSTDGAIAYFGADHAPASAAENASPQSGTPTDPSTHSAWGEPVLHPVSGDPVITPATTPRPRAPAPRAGAGTSTSRSPRPASSSATTTRRRRTTTTWAAARPRPAVPAR
ncbi:hypothetical protein ACFQZC_03255 [Streptacidiphilus monticola]